MMLKRTMAVPSLKRLSLSTRTASRLGTPSTRNNATTETGFATVLGAGYEIKLSNKLFLTPAFDWFQSSYQKRDDETLHERLFNFSLSLTWQPGR